MKQFVAMTDDLLYRPDVWPGPLVPYQIGVFCWHRLREEASESLRAARAAELRTLDAACAPDEPREAA